MTIRLYYRFIHQLVISFKYWACSPYARAVITEEIWVIRGYFISTDGVRWWPESRSCWRWRAHQWSECMEGDHPTHHVDKGFGKSPEAGVFILHRSTTSGCRRRYSLQFCWYGVMSEFLKFHWIVVHSACWIPITVFCYWSLHHLVLLLSCSKFVFCVNSN